MLQIADKISIGLLGVIAAGKTTITRAMEDSCFKTHLTDHLLEGNFWVPQNTHVSPEGLAEDLFARYAQDPKRHAFEFQIAQLANRFERHHALHGRSGVHVIDMPLAADRWGYGEANRENMGASFDTYAKLFDILSVQAPEPDVYVYLRIAPEQIETLLARIKHRGRSQEQGFLQDSSYLSNLIQLYEQFATRVNKPVIVVDASKIELQTGDTLDTQYLQRTLEYVAKEARKHCPPPRLTLDEWEAIDHNTAQRASRLARKQLRGYLAENQRVITTAGLVGSGKTGFAELLHHELDIEILRELEGRNDQVADELLAAFLADKATHCYNLQKYLTPKRAGARSAQYQQGHSFVEDRSPEEDQAIFHARFEQQGYLSAVQIRELRELARTTYQAAPRSDCMIVLQRDPQEARRMILKRGRRVEVRAWPLEELTAMHRFYDPNVFSKVVQDLGAHQGPIVNIDLSKFDPRNLIHQGYLFQEIYHGMLRVDEQRRAA